MAEEMSIGRATERLLAGLGTEDVDTLRNALMERVVQRVVHGETLDGFLGEEIQILIRLAEEDDGFYRACGAELWEACVVLEALSPGESVRQLSKVVVHLSHPRELLLTWKSTTACLLSYDSPSPGFVARIFELSETPLQLLDLCKSASSYCLAHLATVLQAKDLLPLLTGELDDYLLLLCKEMEEAYKFVRGEEFGTVIRSFAGRVEVLGEDQALLAGLKMATVMLGLLADTDEIERNQRDCVQLLLAMGQDLHSLLLTWRSWFTSLFSPMSTSDLHNYSARGIAFLAHLSLQSSPHRNLHLPCVFSPLYRLQVYLPIANLVFYTHPQVAIAILDHALAYFEGQFRSIRSPFLLVPEGKQSTEKFLKEMLDFMGRTQEDDLRKRLISLFRRFLSYFSDTVSFTQHRQVLLHSLVLTYPHDTAVGLVLDIYLAYSKTAEAFQSHPRIYQLVKNGLRKHPPADYPNTIQSAAMMYYYHLLAARRTGSPFGDPNSIRKVRTKLLEPAIDALGKAFEADRERLKLEMVLASLGRVVEVSKELERQ